MAKRVRAVAVLCVALAFILACHVAAPALYAAEDGALLAGYLPRRRLEGRLSSDAMDIFLVRRLHERAGDPAYTGYQRGEEEQAALREEMRGWVESCRPLLDEANFAALWQALGGEDAVYTGAQDSHGLWQYLCDFGGGQGMMGVECEPLSGAVVRLWVQSRIYTGGSGADGKLVLYSEALGLDALPDWQAGAGYYTATLTSENAGLMLYLYDRDGAFQLGVEVYDTELRAG